jgi:hypothetical protein
VRCEGGRLRPKLVNYKVVKYEVVKAASTRGHTQPRLEGCSQDFSRRRYGSARNPKPETL